MRWLPLLLLGSLGCTSTQSDMVEPTIDPPGPQWWIDPPPPPPRPPPLHESPDYIFAAVELTLAQALRHQAVQADPFAERDDDWIAVLSRVSCSIVGCGPCVGHVEVERVPCGYRVQLSVRGCGP